MIKKYYSMMYFMNENYMEWFYRKWVGTELNFEWTNKVVDFCRLLLSASAAKKSSQKQINFKTT